VLAIAEWVLIVVDILVAGRLLRQAGRRPHPPVPLPAVVLWLVVAIPSVLQFVFPALLRVLEREPNQIEHHGQVWRVLTYVVVQDGGVVGTVGNLVLLAAVALATAHTMRSGATVGVFVLGALWFAGVSLAFGRAGAGNSGATFCLGACLGGLAVIHGRDLLTRVLGVLPAIPGIVLIALSDVHGYALVFGTLVGLALGRLVPKVLIGLPPGDAHRKTLVGGS